MRALLTPEVANGLGIVLFRPGPDLMYLFKRGRVLIEEEPENYATYPTGAIPPASQPLAEEPMMKAVFENKKVIARAGGLVSLDRWLECSFVCQWPHNDYHSPHFTLFRHHPGSIRLCWACDNQLRDQTTERLAGIARENLVSWILSVVLRELGFSDDHQLTLPEFCWWMVRSGLADVIPEGIATKAMGMKPEEHQSVMRESDIVPRPAATEVLQERAKKVLTIKVDDESPESFMLRPKRRRWENEKYTRWVKAQPCACCNKQADDPHHLIGHGQGGMGTKAHDLFVLPLCRLHHRELHVDTVAFEKKYGSQLELIFRFIDRALAIGVLA